MSRLSRRQFLLAAAASGLTVALSPTLGSVVRSSVAAVPGVSAATTNRVVHTHCSYATDWDYKTGWYGNYVNQAVVDLMTDLGVTRLTGTSTSTDAWAALVPGDNSLKKVAIKINLNNATCDDSDQVIDALPQPVNSVIRGLKAVGFQEQNIRAYDVTSGWHNGEMPGRLVGKVTALYPNVQFHSNEPACSTALGYSSTAFVAFNAPSPYISHRPVCNALVEADYLINMPIMKKHGMAGVTLGFKNHFGSIQGCDQVHWSVDLGDASYTPTYSGLIDIYNNSHFKGKTVLTVGDGLYGARIDNYSEIPSPWPTFGNQSPNSLFFSRDPVALDSVMYDFLNAEGGVPDGSDNYLSLAAAAGLGTFEHWDTSHRYSVIDYERIEAGLDLRNHIFLPLVRR